LPVDFLVVQFLNGLSSASELFLVSAGLSIIFGVTRVVNFAHGSFYMLGAYIAYTLVSGLAGFEVGFWAALALAPLAVAFAGGLVEVSILKRIYRAPELFQLLATFGVVLIVQDLVLLTWGADDKVGPRAPGLEGAVPVLGQAFPTYDLFLIALGPVVLAGLWLLFRRTRWGTLVRAATEDRDMVAALGVREGRLFTSVFVLGSLLAGLGGAVQLPREAVHHTMDLEIIVEAFVVVVIGGLGSVTGAYLASVLLGVLGAFGIVVFPQITLVLVFLVMAVVLVVRPRGLCGRAETGPAAAPSVPEPPPRPQSQVARNWVFVGLLGLAILPVFADAYTLSVATEILIFVLFAMSLHFLMGVGGMVSFGHAAYFGLGAYGAALAVAHFAAPMSLALLAGALLGGLGALLVGWFCVRLSGVYLAMLTLAFAQIAWSVAFQWYAVTGGDNGILGVWPAPWASGPQALFYLTLAVIGAAIFALRRVIFAPFGYGLRACRDNPARAEAIGIDRVRHQWLGFALAGTFAALAGALYAFLKGSVFPDALSVSVSVDGLVMVLLGGIHTLNGPVVGAVVYKLLQIVLSSYTEYWRLVIGVVIIALVVAFPNGLVGFVESALGARRNGGGGHGAQRCGADDG
jgi:branched-chain amino acid transport system permease protein